ncbi:hypothetical protein NPA08_02205 [Mycoplasmopsis citelli]|uniref:Uncharacterized protein n=1 Tax=Mycoplasmopsis citelli TaxID=171281 RepID=A0A449B0W7_9BACT|nr:hypothetical protein [Mycoplasmopsis citelli]UUD36617.1 hypothetical protein NPA08_02205 [Mycoplasmopsis citelli]VEU74258.1 Uncharacterised protein [Mycoplasmopsis citelli]
MRQKKKIEKLPKLTYKMFMENVKRQDAAFEKHPAKEVYAKVLNELAKM